MQTFFPSKADEFELDLEALGREFDELEAQKEANPNTKPRQKKTLRRIK